MNIDGFKRLASGEDTLYPRAIFAADLVHLLGAVAGIIFQDRATGGPATKAMRLAEIFHAILDVGLGIIERPHFAFVADVAGRGRHDLHQADFAGSSSRFGFEVAFILHNRFREAVGNAVGLGMATDDAGIFRRTRVHRLLRSLAFRFRLGGWLDSGAGSVLFPVYARQK